MLGLLTFGHINDAVWCLNPVNIGFYACLSGPLPPSMMPNTVQSRHLFYDKNITGTYLDGFLAAPEGFIYEHGWRKLEVFNKRSARTANITLKW